MDYDEGIAREHSSGTDEAGGTEVSMPGGTAGGPGQGDSLEDASEEAVAEIEKRRDGGGHAGAGDIG